MAISSQGAAAMMETAATGAKASGVFASVEVGPEGVVCGAAGSEAEYRLTADGGELWVEVSMADRWLSESIEADLMHSGDPLGELIEEELADEDIDTDGPVPFEHFRSDEMKFVFRSRVVVEVDGPEAAATALKWLLAYERCFAGLGDIGGDDSD